MDPMQPSSTSSAFKRGLTFAVAVLFGAALAWPVVGQDTRNDEAPPPPVSSQEEDLPTRTVVIDVEACGVCRTDLQLCEGDLEAHALPIIPGHQVVGTVAEEPQTVPPARPLVYRNRDLIGEGLEQG